MSKFLLRACVVLCLFAMPSPASAQSNLSPQAQVAAILAQFPNGGQGLADAIALAVEANPSLASAVAVAAQTGTLAQQQAMGRGLAQAATFFANSGGDAAQAAAAQIQTALALAPAATLSSFNSSGGTAALLAISGGTNSNITTNSCVSPAQPGNGC